MKKHLAILLLCMIPFTTFARENSAPDYAIHLGISSPVSPDDFSDFWATGANAGVGIEKIVSSHLRIGAAAALHYFTIDRRGVENHVRSSQDIVAIGGEHASTVNLQFKMRTILPNKSNSRSISYFYGAAGMTRIAQDAITILYQTSSTSIDARTDYAADIEGGFGIELNLEDSFLFVELGANVGFTTPHPAAVLPIKVGFRF